MGSEADALHISHLEVGAVLPEGLGCVHVNTDTAKFSLFYCITEGFFIANGATGNVYHYCIGLHLCDSLFVYKVTWSVIQGGMDSDDIGFAAKSIDICAVISIDGGALIGDDLTSEGFCHSRHLFAYISETHDAPGLPCYFVVHGGKLIGY